MASELEHLKCECNKLTDESLGCTRHMLALCKECRDAGAGTHVMLDAQGEQVDCIGDGMDQISEDLEETERRLSGCGLCTILWQKFKQNHSNMWGNVKVTGTQHKRSTPIDTTETGNYVGCITGRMLHIPS